MKHAGQWNTSPIHGKVGSADRIEIAISRSAVLQAAKDTGLGREAYEILKHWLQQKPNELLLDAWKGYISALSASTRADVREKLKLDLLGRARHVAEIAGGVLGIKKISKSEQIVLDSLESAFL